METEAAPALLHSPPSLTQPAKISSIKTLAESPGLTSIPVSCTFTPDPCDQVVSDSEVPVPVVDYSLLVSGNPDQRSKTIHQLGKACQHWGFFKVINHGVPESLIRSMIDGMRGFFDLPDEEKQEYQGKHVLDPIRYGTSFNASVENEKVFLWRDLLKVFVHPVFHSPTKPAGFSEISLEYSKRVRAVTRELLKGISESLGLEGNFIDQAMDLDHGLQSVAGNLYPPCPQPELAIGLPPHSDHGLLTLLMQNGIGGLQIQYQGKWVNIDTVPNTFLVNTGDHLEILSNGKYKSVLHRAMVNNKATRISIVSSLGPSLDSVVSPAAGLIDERNAPAAYIGMKYKDFMELQQSIKAYGKSCLDRVRISAA